MTEILLPGPHKQNLRRFIILNTPQLLYLMIFMCYFSFIWPLLESREGGNPWKFLVPFLGNGVSRKIASEIYWPLDLESWCEFNTELRKWEWHPNCAHAFLSMKHPKLSQLKMFLWEYSDFCYKQLSSVSSLFFNCGIQEDIKHFLMWKLVLQQKSKDFQCK